MTLADIHRHADSNGVSTGTDDTTPPGTFYAVATVLGMTTAYLLAGDVDNPAAPILGRIEYGHRHVAVAYIGDRLKGGQMIRVGEDEAEVFARMLAARTQGTS